MLERELRSSEQCGGDIMDSHENVGPEQLTNSLEVRPPGELVGRDSIWILRKFELILTCKKF